MTTPALSRPVISRGWTSLAAAIVLAVLLLLGFRLALPQAQSVHPAAVTQVHSAVRLDLPAQPAAPSCMLSGDLVGDGNPADVAKALCGDH